MLPHYLQQEFNTNTIRRIVAAAVRPDRRRVQRTSYFLQKVWNIPTNYHFIYHYGPYSIDLSNQLDDLILDEQFTVLRENTDHILVSTDSYPNHPAKKPHTMVNLTLNLALANLSKSTNQELDITAKLHFLNLHYIRGNPDNWPAILHQADLQLDQQQLAKYLTLIPKRRLETDPNR